MSIKAEGSTQFTFNIVENGADSARERIVALQNAIDQLKNSAKSPISLNIALNKGAESLLKGLAKDALKAGQDVKNNFEKGLEGKQSTAEKVLKENQKRASKVVDDYIGDRKKEIAKTNNAIDDEYNKASKNIEAANNAVTEAKQAHDRLNEVFQDYNEGRASKDDIRNAAREAYARADSIVESYGDMLERRADGTKEAIDDIQIQAANALNDLYYDSDENRIGRGNRPDNWEDSLDIESYADSEAIAKQKEQFLKAAQEQSDLNKAKIENLKQHKLQLEEQVEAANDLKKQISQAKSVDEIQNSMKSIEGMGEFKPVKDHKKEAATKSEAKTQEEKGLNLVGDLEKGRNDFVINVTAEGVETAKGSLESLNGFLSELKAAAQDPIRLNISMSEDVKKLFNGDKSLLEKYQQTGKELAQSMQQGLAEGVGKSGEGRKKTGASEFIDKYMDAEVKRSNDLQEKIAKKQQSFTSKHADSLNKAFEKFESEAGLLSNQDLTDATASKKSASAAQKFLEKANSYTADELAEFEKAMPGIQDDIEQKRAKAVEYLNKISAASQKSSDQDLQEVLSNVSSSSLSDEELAKTIQANAAKNQTTRQSGKAYQNYFENQAKMQEELALSAKNQAKRANNKVSKSASDLETSNILKDFAESVNPSDQSIKTGIQSVSKNIQSKIGDALDSFNSAKMQGGDMTDFYKKMTESAFGESKPVGNYLLDTFNKMNKFSDRDFDALAKNLQVADPGKFKDVSTNQLKQMRSVMGDMANEYSNVYAQGLQNVDSETISAIESYQPKFNKALDKIYNQGSAASSPSQNFGSRSLGSEYEKLVSTPNEVTTPSIDWKINIEPSPETILSQVEQIKSAISGLSSEGQTINIESNIKDVLADLQSVKAEMESLSAQKVDSAKDINKQVETEKKAEKSASDVDIQKVEKPQTADVTGEAKASTLQVDSATVSKATAETMEVANATVSSPVKAGSVEAESGTANTIKANNIESGDQFVNAKVNVTGIEQSGDQTIDVKAKPTSIDQAGESLKAEIDPNKVQETVSSQPVEMPIKGNTEELKSELQNLNGHVNLDSNIDELKSELNALTAGPAKAKDGSKMPDPQKDVQKSVSQGVKDAIPDNFFNSATRDNIDNYKNTLAPLMQDKALEPLVKGLQEEFGKRMSDPSILPSQDYGNALVDTVNKELDKDLSSKISKVQGKDDESVNAKRAKIIEDELSEARKQLRSLDKKYKIADEDQLLGSASSSAMASRYGFDPNKAGKKAYDGFGNAVADALVSRGYETTGFNVSSDNKGRMATSFINQGLQEKAPVQRIQYKDAAGQDQFAFVKKPSSYSKSDQLSEEIYRPLVDRVVDSFQKMGAKFSDSNKYVQSEAVGNLVKESQDLARLAGEAVIGDPTKTKKDLTGALNKVQKEQAKKFEALGKNLDLDGGNNPVLDVLDSNKFGWKNSLTGQDRRDAALKMIKSSLEAVGINPERLSVQSESNGAFRAQYALNNEKINSTFKFDDIEGSNGQLVKISQGSIKRSENDLLTKQIQAQIYDQAKQQIESMGDYLRDSDKYLPSQTVDSIRNAGIELLNSFFGQVAKDPEMKQNQANSEIKKIQSKNAGIEQLNSFFDQVAKDPEMKQNQANSEIKKIQSKMGSAYKALEKSLDSTGYLGNLDSGFLENLSERVGKDRKRYVEDALQSVLRGKGENFSNFKVKSETGNGFIVQRTVDGQKKTSTLQLGQYQDAQGKPQIAVRETAMQAEDVQGSWAKWGSNVAKKFKGLTEYLTSMMLAQQVFTEMAQGLEFVQSTDKALSNIAMTMDASDKQLAELKQRSIQTGIDLKTDSKNVVQAATIYANANEDANSILEKAKSTVLLSNASGQTADVSSDQIQAVNLGRICGAIHILDYF